MAEPDITDDPSPAREYRKKLLGGFFDLRDFWRLRKRIIADPLILRSRDVAQDLTPFVFASQSVFLPFMFIGGLIAAMAAFVAMPPTFAERQIANQQKLVELIDRYHKIPHSKLPLEPALATLSSDQLTMRRKQIEAGITQNLAAASSDATIERHKKLWASWKAIAAAEDRLFASGTLAPIAKQAAETKLRIQQYRWAVSRMSEWSEALVGGFIVASAYLFGWGCRRLKPPPVHADAAEAAFLYTVGTFFFWPSCALATLFAAEDLASRYQWQSVIFAIITSRSIVFILALRPLVRAGELLPLILDQLDGRQMTRVGWVFVGVFVLALAVSLMGTRLLMDGLMKLVPVGVLS